MDFKWILGAGIIGFIIYEVAIKHPVNLQNASAIIKDPKIPQDKKLGKYLKDKSMIDKAYEKTPYTTYVQNDQPYFTSM